MTVCATVLLEMLCVVCIKWKMLGSKNNTICTERIKVLDKRKMEEQGWSFWYNIVMKIRDKTTLICLNFLL